VTNPPEKRQYSSPEEAARIYLLPNLFTAGNMLCGFLAIKNCIEARFTSAQGRVTATLKVRITGNAIKHDCDIEVEKKANDDNDAGDESSDDNNGARADD